MAPGNEAWNAPDEEAFERAYLDQLEKLGAESILADIERISGDRAAVLLCWEKPHEALCHRWDLGRWLEDRAGIVVRELQPGDLPPRLEAPQMRLF